MHPFSCHSARVCKTLAAKKSAVNLPAFQKLNMTFSIYLLFVLASNSFGAVRSGGLKVLGGFVSQTSPDERIYYGKYFLWGKWEADSNSKDLTLEGMYCRDIVENRDAFCHLHLIVSTLNDPNEGHYQIIGTFQKILDGRIFVERANENGLREIDLKPPYERIQVANCKMWSKARGEFKHGDLYFIVKWTTQGPDTDDISYIIHKQASPNVKRDEIFLDYHQSDSEKVLVFEARTWTKEWRVNSYLRAYFWKARAVLREVHPLYGNARTISSARNVIKAIVLENGGFNVTPSEFPVVSTKQTVTTTSQSRFLNSWDFSFSVESTTSFQAVAASGDVSLQVEFSASSEREETHARSVEEIRQIEFPDECRAGFRLTFAITEVVVEQDLPLNLTFRRAGVDWSQINVARVTLRRIDISSVECCLPGNESCTPRDRICDKLQV